jgi:hypothetical protein
MEETAQNARTAEKDVSAEAAITPPPFIGIGKKVLSESESEAGGIRDLLEKNLKWSQIIYEQNRRISRRLLWQSILSWVKWLIIGAVIIWSTWYAWPIIQGLTNQYNSIMKQLQLAPGGKFDSASLDQIFKNLSLTPEQQEQLKAMTK